MSIYKEIFKTSSELNQKEITKNSEDILKMRYFIDRDDDTKETTFSQLCRRVSRILTSVDTTKDIEYKKNIEKSIYNDMLSQRFLFNSPCLFNAGVGISKNPKISKYIYSDEVDEETYTIIRNNTSNNQMLFACFVIDVPDSLEGIFDSVKKAAIISKSGGGVGANFGNIREKNSDIKNGENGKASGPVSFMKTWNTMGEVVQQGGKRRSALMGMLYSNHPDIEEFIDAKTEEGVLSYFNISVAIDDLFMKAVKDDLDYCLVSPKDKTVIRTIKARDLYDKICSNAWKRGDPGVFFIDTANKDSLLKINESYSIAASNPCCTGDTLVATPNGWIRADNINEGDLLITTLGIEPVKTKEVNENIDTYLVEFSDGGSVKVTASHVFQAIKKRKGNKASKKFDFIQLKDLEIGDYVRVIPGKLPNNKINTFGFEERDFGFIIGSLFGDGCITENILKTNKFKICFGLQETKWMEEFEKIFNKYNIKYSIYKNPTTYDLTSYDKNIINMIKTYKIYGYSYDKNIPIEILNSNKNILEGIVDGLISTDGNINLKTTNPSIRIKSCNKKIIETFRKIMLSFGCIGYCYKISRDKDCIIGCHCNARDVYEFTITGASLKTFYENITISNPYKQKKIIDIINFFNPTGNTWKVRITNITKLKKETVYDFYCEKSDTWSTEGYSSQGCGEQNLPDNSLLQSWFY